ncbi:BRO family, N-terminal domain protein, partial [Escherichia coli P0302308.4]
MSALAVFSFQEEHQVRVVMINGDPWFVAADVCNAIGIINHRDAVGKLDEDEKGVGSTDTLGGKQGVTIINESGLYTLILRCRDAVKQGTTAWRFRKWVTNEVLPSIRKNGEYVYVEPEPMRAAEPLNWRQKE